MASPLWNPRLVIFDLDGTLVDSVEDIAHSVNELLQELGRPPLPLATVRDYIGSGVRQLVLRAIAPAGEREVGEAVDRYLSIYRRRLLDHTRPYPGVREALEELERNRVLAVLTNKPRSESLRILEGLSLAARFRAVYGGDSFPRRKPHPDGVLHLLSELGCEAEETLFVGDSAVDVETARNASVRSCLVSYGLGFPEGRALAPDLLVDDLRELARAVAAR